MEQSEIISTITAELKAAGFTDNQIKSLSASSELPRLTQYPGVAVILEETRDEIAGSRYTSYQAVCLYLKTKVTNDGNADKAEAFELQQKVVKAIRKAFKFRPYKSAIYNSSHDTELIRRYSVDVIYTD
jgi:hypothetical protein